ncbi:MAG: beta-propeller fold lactonase family protein, partial [Bacteroidota bacterium]
QSAVYTLGNEVAGNEVIAFYRNDDGSLYEAGRYGTGGTGSGGGLGNQAALAMSSGGKFLYAVNPGSNEISHFLIRNDGSLELKNRIASGGVLPVSIAVHNGLVYVLNAGGTGNITGFAFNQQGQIFQLSNSTRALSSPSAGAAQIAFSPDGKVLVVTEKATNTISSYPVLSSGRTGAIRTFPSANATPFGFAFGRNGNFHVSEAAGGAAGASTISTYHVNIIGQVSLVDGPFALNQSAACWVALAKNNSLLFSTNTGSNTISTLDVSFSGVLSAPASGGTATAMSQPLDAAVDKDSDHLYVLATGNNAIISYTFDSNGKLTQIDVDDENLPDRMSGLVVRG